MNENCEKYGHHDLWCTTPTECAKAPARANLEEAWRLTHGNRKASYGDVRTSFDRYAKIWSGLLGAKLREDLTASDVALLMTALKLAREANKQQSDNVVDAHGYLILHDEIKEANNEGR
jgi:hypothetical protein